MKKCENCKILESKLLALANKYDRLAQLSMRGKDISDIDRTLAENKIIEAFRKAGVFSPVGSMHPSAFIGGGITQTVDLQMAQKVIKNLILHV